MTACWSKNETGMLRKLVSRAGGIYNRDLCCLRWEGAVGLWISLATPDWARADVAVITALTGPAVCQPASVTGQLASTRSPAYHDYCSYCSSAFPCIYVIISYVCS